MVVLRCAGCREVIIDTKKGINQVTKMEDYELVAKTDIGEFGIGLKHVGTKYVCNYCGHEINTEKLREKGINIEELMSLADNKSIELAKQRMVNGDN